MLGRTPDSSSTVDAESSQGRCDECAERTALNEYPLAIERPDGGTERRTRRLCRACAIEVIWSEGTALRTATDS